MPDDMHATYATYTAEDTQHFVCLLCSLPPGHEATDWALFTQHMHQRHAGMLSQGDLPEGWRSMQATAAAPTASEEPLTIAPDEEEGETGEEVPVPAAPAEPEPETEEQPEAPGSKEHPEGERT